MKNSIISLLLIFSWLYGSSQNPYNYEYRGRSNPSIKKEELKNVQLVTDISYELWHKMKFPPKVREVLDSLRKIYYPLGYYVYPPGGYNEVIDYVSVEISSTVNGKLLSAQNISEKLTHEQKNILNTADLGSDIKIKIRFKYKFKTSDSPDLSKVVEGISTVTVVPEIEAEYPGGFKQITEYLNKNVINEISKTGTSEKLRRAIVKFTVSEEGQIVNAKISQTSGNSDTDKILLNAINRMPKWKPAKNSTGENVKQEFIIPFANDGC